MRRSMIDAGGYALRSLRSEEGSPSVLMCVNLRKGLRVFGSHAFVFFDHTDNDKG
jgi:hypothetical protein